MDSTNQAYVPTIPELYFRSKGTGKIPLSVKEGRKWAGQEGHTFQNEIIVQDCQTTNEVLIKAKKLWFRYDKKSDFILKNLDFTLCKNEIYALLGGNGSGKSTFLKAIANLLKWEQGKIDLYRKSYKSYKNDDLTRRIGYLPQNPKLFFLEDTVEKEIRLTIDQWGRYTGVDNLLNDLGISHLTHHHPYDLSGGEIQKAALACLLIRSPEILLLDEPTKGLDPISKDNLANILQKLSKDGATIVMSTHDVEFAAKYATRCGMMFQGSITSEDIPTNFFKGNFFYTTMMQRLCISGSGKSSGS